MIRLLCVMSLTLIAGAMIAGCANDPSDRNRPGHNIDNRSPQSGQYRFDERPPASSMDPYSRSQSGGY